MIRKMKSGDPVLMPIFRPVLVILFSFLLPFFASRGNAQEFLRHGLKTNTLTGHQWGITFFGDVHKVTGSDYQYEDALTKGPFLFGLGTKITLKNHMDRGIGFGAGLEYSTNGYFRVNALLDLDFLFHFMATDGSLGESVFSKFKFTSLIGQKDGKPVREFYLGFYFIQIHVKQFSLGFGLNKGILRSKYPPVYADQGIMVGLSYSIKR